MKSIYLIFLGLLLNLSIGYAQITTRDLLQSNGMYNPTVLIPTPGFWQGVRASKFISEISNNTNGWRLREAVKYNYSANCQRIISEQECGLSPWTNSDTCSAPFVYVCGNLNRIVSTYYQKYKYIGNNPYPDTVYNNDRSDRYVYTYTPQNLVATKIWQTPTSSPQIYENINTYTFSYDNTGRLIQSSYAYSSSTPTVRTYSYNSRNQISQILSMRSDSSKTVCNYDALGRLTGFTPYKWSNNQWNDVSSTGYLNVKSFNSKNRPLVIESFKWDSNAFTREEWSYYGNDTLVQRWIFSAKVLATDPWQNYERYSFEYCGVPTTATKEVEELVFSISPNPVTDHLQVNYTEGSIHQIQITGLTGQVLLQKDVNDKQAEIDVSALSKGLYLITVETTDGQRGVRKFVKN